MRVMEKAIACLLSVHQVTFLGTAPDEEIAIFLSDCHTNGVLKQSRLYETLACDPDYTDAYSLQIVTGGSFSEEYSDDVDKLATSEAAVRNLGFASNDEAIDELATMECTDVPT